ncbi:MAG: hypothetical protein OEZ06_17640 [Myxococcales bacterium]|nr:hypothetical protein [Myxococcales bacterium]
MDEDNGDRRSRAPASDAPVDLRHEREDVLRTFLRKGIELTEDLISDNAALKRRVEGLEQENATLRRQVAHDDAMRELLSKIQQLEAERLSILSRSAELEDTTRQHEGRHEQIEAELNDLASLYVASQQLSGTLKPARVVQHICEMLEQLVGARRFVLYLVETGVTHALPVAHIGFDENLPRLALEGGAIADACLTGVDRIHEPDEVPEGGEPLAVIPLVMGDVCVAVIAVYELLEHKTEWATVDRELFHLLRRHGAIALIGATLYHDAPDARSVLQALASIPVQPKQPRRASEGSEVQKGDSS